MLVLAALLLGFVSYHLQDNAIVTTEEVIPVEEAVEEAAEEAVVDTTAVEAEEATEEEAPHVE